jgi:YfiH family protein
MTLSPHTLDILKLPGVLHGFFDRHGGLSPSPMASLNFSHGDGELYAAENRRRVLDFFGGGMDLVGLKQVHGDRVVRVGASHGKGDGLADSDAEEADALCTDIPGKLLLIQTADYQAILFADPVKKVVAASHSGWRGSVQNIAAKTVETLMGEFGCHPEDIRAGIGPSLGPCCAEFIHWRQELPWEFSAFQRGDTHFDFWAITRMQLETCGLKPDHIAHLGACTRCEDRWFSYRREGRTGRLGAVIGLGHGELRH